MTATDEADDADLVVLNTCHIREKATEKVYSDIGRLTPRRRARADDRGRRLRRAGRGRGDRAPRAKVDIVVGPQAYHNLPALVAEASRGETALDTDMPVLSKFGALPARRRSRPPARS